MNVEKAFNIQAQADKLEANDGLQALISFARVASKADMAIAFEATETGLATTLAASPEPLPEPFELGDTGIEQMDWSKGIQSAANLRLPVPVLLALGGSARDLHFIPTPILGAPRSGILLLWTAQQKPQCVCSLPSDVGRSMSMLAQVFTQLLNYRRDAMQRKLMSERFNDLFESVPSGIVILNSDGEPSLVNEPAAALLGGNAGEIEVTILAAQMRTLRESCVNASELQAAYTGMINNVDYAASMLWDLGHRQFKVDTHSMLGAGRNGRIWLFNDITAQYQLEQNLRGLASTDPLTGLANRRQFTESGAAMLRKTTAEALHLSVLILDIDHFKSINDRYGHHVGDVVLQTFALRCQANLRQEDLMARLGGEEFAVVLPGASMTEAALVAQRLRTVVAASPILIEKYHIKVSVSIGATTRQSDDQTLDDLLNRADQALYTAKKTGRNKVVFSKDDHTET